MLGKIRLTDAEMKYIALFESVTGATVLDCILDEKRGSVIIVVKKGDMGLAIGKKGAHIRLLQRITGKNIDVIEYHDDPKEFIINALKPARVHDIKFMERMNGDKISIVKVDVRDKGIAIGKNGQNIEKIRLLARRYFQLQTVVIV